MQDALKFILHGVHASDNLPAKPSSKFTSKPKKKAGGRIQTGQTHEGYLVKMANVASVSFEGEKVVQHCWWDTQPFDEDPLCIPYDYQSIRDIGKSTKHVFKGPGGFCSIFCLWAYLMEEQRKQHSLRDSRLETAIQLAKLAFHAMYEPDIVLKAAPDWRLIDIYGGPLTISQFRKASYDKTYTRLPNVLFEPAAIQFLQE